MKLLTKLTLFITLSKMVIVGFFILLLPLLVERIAFEYTNYYLKQQQKKVLEVVKEKGIDFCLQGDTSYGSYTLLKEEYISLEPASAHILIDTIETAQRVIENDTLTYRLLTHAFGDKGKRYILEIGKTTSTISQYKRPLQRVALYVLIGLTGLSLIADLLFTRILLRPLGLIIRKKLINQKFPFRDHLEPIRTSTTDFKYLDQSLTMLISRINEDFDKEKQFTSNASHELMTPIGILQSKMENLLMDEELNDEAQQKLTGMMKTLSRLKKIVNSLLLISRIENEQYIRTDRVVVATMFGEIMDELSHRAEEQELQVNLKLSGSAVLINMNRDLIFQLFYNLLTNAIRYNRHGGSIEISDRIDKDQDYIIQIRDTGIGIPQLQLNTVFDRFKKAGASEGNGLGLSIVKSIASYHDIKVRMTSEEGKGTDVQVVFSNSSVAS